jgi:ABC-type antimicrobial peptide transport system permease subunit
MRPVVVGIAVGLAAAAGGARAIQSLLFGVTPNDVPTFALVLASITAGALIACIIPANRATRIDPAVALRAE